MYDIVIIGGGTGGYVAGIRAAQLGARVALIEKDRLGGVCLNWGCIPTKALLAGVALRKDLEKASEFGISTGDLRIDYAVLAARKDTVVKRFIQGIEFLLKKNKVELIIGRGSLSGPGRVRVELTGNAREEISTKSIILATGSEPALIKALGYNGRNIVTSNEALAWQSIPASLLVIGGGVIGCEFAVLHNAMGVRVTIVESLPDIIMSVDKEIAHRMHTLLQKQGIEILTGANIISISEEKEKIKARLGCGRELEAERALIAIGRRINTDGLGLKEAGVVLGAQGEVVVDDYLKTSLSGVYAIGDITGKIQLAHVASAQGIVAVKNILGKPFPMDYQTVPNCIFTLPEIAGVGLTSQDADAQGQKVKIGKFPFMASSKAVVDGETEGMVKIIADEKSGRILGTHILGRHATDLIAEAALAIKHHLTVRQLAETIHGHPTLSEALAEAAESVDGLAINY